MLCLTPLPLTLHLSLTSTAIAHYNGNLNYRSPSLNNGHVNMGIDTHAITYRSLSKRDVEPRCETSELHFTHGVASGDPYADSVILWTRVAPSLEASNSNITVTGDVPLYDHENEKYAKASAHPICVEYYVFCDQQQKKVVDKGRAYTTSDVDYTVKVMAKGLKPFTTYWYQFNICGNDKKSPLGRTKTAPAPRDAVDEVKLAVVSCNNYPTGYFNGFGNIARKDNVDYIVHLGDYIYEYEDGVPGVDEHAAVPQRETFSLYDYRMRLGQCRADPDLLASHQNFPWITIWDNHDIANNGYRDGYGGLRNTEDSFLKDGPQISVDQRKLNAVRAYFEWMPIRQVDMDDGLRIWRNFQMGDLFDLIMIDTRHYDRSITDLTTDEGINRDYIIRIHDDTGRSLMGARQENWFYRQLSESAERGAKWRVIGNQIVFAHVLEQRDDGTISFDTDRWTAYRANQNRTLKHLYDSRILNNINIAGDSHSSWVSDLIWEGTKPYDNVTGIGAVGVEFAGTAMSSGGFMGSTIAAAEAKANTFGAINPELKWVEGYYRGYYELHLRHDKAEARFFGLPTVATRNAWVLPLANFTVKHGNNHLQRPLAGGEVETGFIQEGKLRHSNISLNTETSEWHVLGFDKMYIEH
ncbi:PhoD-like phosphatase-domain-containing protein [Aspergillus pseudoustus]|uniref:PhoD-like phosphatase-domain-containing protein n=1 Tax=Aspergillus pseudoustus TaxID=1810923 RepID=A0ABR4JAM7_9EURO